MLLVIYEEKQGIFVVQYLDLLLQYHFGWQLWYLMQMKMNLSRYSQYKSDNPPELLYLLGLIESTTTTRKFCKESS